MGSKSAVISSCDNYRYWLAREITPPKESEAPRVCVFVMLNPSTADADNDDPTIRRCINFARSFNCTDLVVVNLYAYRATNPRELKTVDDPIGPSNLQYLETAFELAKTSGSHVICAWGADKMTDQMFCGARRDFTVVNQIRRAGLSPQCLDTTSKGKPRHPLYLKKNLTPVDYLGLDVVFDEEDIPF